MTPPNNEGEESMTDVSCPFAVMYNTQVQALWTIVSSVLAVDGSRFRSACNARREHFARSAGEFW